MCSLISLVNSIIQIFIYLIIIQAIMSWLVAFNVVNVRNRFVYGVGEFLHRVTDPVLRPIRQFIPSMGGIDISPVLLILLLVFIQNLLIEYGYSACAGPYMVR